MGLWQMHRKSKRASPFRVSSQFCPYFSSPARLCHSRANIERENAIFRIAFAYLIKLSYPSVGELLNIGARPSDIQKPDAGLAVNR